MQFAVAGLEMGPSSSVILVVSASGKVGSNLMRARSTRSEKLASSDSCLVTMLPLA